MGNARNGARWRAGVALTTVLMLAAAACGGSSSGGGGNGGSSGSSGQTIVWGTTDKPVSYDPAGAYDLPSWNVIYNVYQTLVRVDPATEKLVGDAATGCLPSKDLMTWTCQLKPDQKFSNGDPVTPQDVKFSFDRMVKINDPAGPAALLIGSGSLTNDAGKVTKPFTVDAVGTDKVVFHLAKPNALWNQVIGTGAGAIVDSKVFPADKKLPDSQVIGSGPYMLKTYQPNQIADFLPNPNYGGDLTLANDGLVIKYYADENSLKLDVTAGKVDVVYPALSPTALNQLKSKTGLNEISGPGGFIEYMVFNEKTMPGDNDAQKRAIRRAVAYLLDRQSISDNVYQGTAAPLYTMVAKGLPGATDVFKTEFGASPDKAKAAQELQQAGVSTPVKLQVWWTPTHYGTLSGDEYTEIKRQLDGSGLFNVDLQSTEWEQYSGDCRGDKCPVYQLGWFPDYPDTDDYVGSFFSSSSFVNDHYTNAKADQLIHEEQSSTDQAKRIQLFQQIQQVTVADAPIIPIRQGIQVAVTHGTVTGVQDTLKPDYIFRFWLLGKS